jgi:hypothetical protein
MFLDKGTRPTTGNLEYIYAKDNLPILKMFLEKGAEPTKKMLFQLGRKNVDIVKLFLENRVNPSVDMFIGAIQSNCYENAKVILGKDVSLADQMSELADKDKNSQFAELYRSIKGIKEDENSPK